MINSSNSPFVQSVQLHRSRVVAVDVDLQRAIHRVKIVVAKYHPDIVRVAADRYKQSKQDGNGFHFGVLSGVSLFFSDFDERQP